MLVSLTVDGGFWRAKLIRRHRERSDSLISLIIARGVCTTFVLASRQLADNRAPWSFVMHVSSEEFFRGCSVNCGWKVLFSGAGSKEELSHFFLLKSIYAAETICGHICLRISK